MSFSDYIQLLTAMIAILNPLSVVPLFLSFTDNQIMMRPKIAIQTGVAVAVILGVSVFIGQDMLNFFSITTDGFRVAGGILLFIMGLNMLHAQRGRTRHTKEEDEEAIKSESIAVVPLAMPLLAGPGSISTAILFSAKYEGWLDKLLLVSVCCLVGCVVWFCFTLAPQISRRIGATGMNIFTRVMGLVLAAIAVEFIVGGLRNLLPGLAGA